MLEVELLACSLSGHGTGHSREWISPLAFQGLSHKSQLYAFQYASADAAEWSIRQTWKRFKEGWREKRGRHLCVWEGGGCGYRIKQFAEKNAAIYFELLQLTSVFPFISDLSLPF